MNKIKINLVYADLKGKLYDDCNYVPALRSGRNFFYSVYDISEDLIKLPFGSSLFYLPKRSPVIYNTADKTFTKLEKIKGIGNIQAACAFLSSGYLRLYLPAYFNEHNAPILPLWAYCAVFYKEDDFCVPAIRIDSDPRSDPQIHQDIVLLNKKIKQLIKAYPTNSIIRQLKLCATHYNCLCARNFFLSRHEAPVPTTQACNARCLGCLSYQENNSAFPPSQYRLHALPTPEEICEIIVHHFNNVKNAVASFGQGCEGEPLLRAKDLAKAICLVREKTDKGTINLNTNGSMPDKLKLLIKAGLNSVRISFNSLNPLYYEKYFRPLNYSFNDVIKSIELSLENKIFTSINLFFLPGFTDSEEEVEHLFKFLDKYKINMIQTRNFNIDPDYYLDNIDFKNSKPLGIKTLLSLITNKYPHIKLGYYNPPINSK